MATTDTQAVDTFTEFFAIYEPRLRHALIARCGAEIGREATADALEYAWSHWDRVGSMAHPAAYLYRVGQSASRRYRRPQGVAGEPQVATTPWFEPALEPALAKLSDRQRVAVVLRHSFGYRFDEIADVMGISISSVQKHIDRGLQKLRRRLEVSP
ncbi:MAG: sigma-70 family RNA polymerase sigma factor [Acidimicrobiia bacterium]|nr:sigma-70 family RNA polymerase sigma factor [Acidimicrobiia bacterium]